jgi:hypothetical protein
MLNNRTTQSTLQPGTYFGVTEGIPGFVALTLWTGKVTLRPRPWKSLAAQRVYNRLEGGLATLQPAAAALTVLGKIGALISLNQSCSCLPRVLSRKVAHKIVFILTSTVYQPLLLHIFLLLRLPFF